MTPTNSGPLRAAVRKPRLGFLGLGWIGLHRMEAIAKSGAAEVVAVADPEPLALERARRQAGTVCAVRSMDELLDRELDGVVIATPSALHAEQACAALAHGVAVFCQKPLARSAEEARRVVSAARVADRLLGVDLSYRHTQGMRQIRELVRRGELQHVYAINLVFHNAYGPGQAWFYDPRLSGGGALIDLGIHLVDLALWVLDFPQVTQVSSRLYEQGRLLTRPREHIEDYVVAQLTLSTGAVVQLACSWKLHAGQDCMIEATFHGTRAGASFRNVGGSFYDFEATLHSGTARRTLAAPPDDWGGRAAVQWAEQLAHDSRFDPSAQHFVDVAQVIDRIYDPSGEH